MLKQPKDYIVFPLDVPSLREARRYLSLLSEHVGMFKVGLELFVQCGPEILKAVRASGPAGIFLDLKLHDIPATVMRTMNVIAEFGVTFVTVHCGESRRMLEAAVKGGGGRVGVLGVTVLTSVSGTDLREAGIADEFFSNLSRLVIRRASAAKTAGCCGVVCSGLEVKMIKEKCGKAFVAVTPGIRPDWIEGESDDQRRITTPAEAIRNGSDYLVVGRPIRDASNPKTAADRIAREIAFSLVSP